MSTNVKVNESPNHFMILDAITRGVNTNNKIAKVTKLHKSEVELIVNDLSAERLIIKNEKRGFFGNKKMQISVTETGIKLLNAKKHELEQQLQQVQQWYNNGDRSQLQGYMDSNRMWIPMMLFSGIMNIMFFTSMMSFTGMALNPMESQMTGDGVAETATSTEGAEDSSQAGVDDSTASGGEGDIVDTGGDFGGFDGGGFGDF
jgi:DNA-binding MarR family transcriptional regulator